MTPTNELVEEHKVILRVIDAVERQCRLAESGSKPDAAFFAKAIDFIRNYADGLHHAKEEYVLFKEMQKCESEMQCNPIEQMLYEHDQGRAFVRGMEAALKSGNSAALVRNALGYTELLRQHIFKEDHILYPMSEEVIGKAGQAKLSKAFRAAEAKLPRKLSEKYTSIAKELESWSEAGAISDEVRGMISYSKDGIVSKVVKKTKSGDATLFCMAAGTEIGDHTSTKKARVEVVEGSGTFTLEGRKIPMTSGKIIEMPKNAVHSLKANKDTSFILTLTS